MLKINPTSSNLFNVYSEEELTELKEFMPVAELEKVLLKEPDNFEVRLALADLYMESSEVEKACQTRLDGVNLFIDVLDELGEQEIELDMSDEFNLLVIDALYMSALDHYNIGDYEMAIAFLELSTELDPEDHFEANTLLTFAYAAFGDKESLEYQLEILTITKDETELLNAIINNNPGRGIKDKTVNALLSINESKYTMLLSPLRLSHENLFS